MPCAGLRHSHIPIDHNTWMKSQLAPEPRPRLASLRFPSCFSSRALVLRPLRPSCRRFTSSLSRLFSSRNDAFSPLQVSLSFRRRLFSFCSRLHESNSSHANPNFYLFFFCQSLKDPAQRLGRHAYFLQRIVFPN